MSRLALKGWAFVPGPRCLVNPPASSLDLHDIANYDPGEIADAFLSYPDVRLLHPAEPSWWEWRAEWRCGQRFITLGMTLFDTEPQYWGGSSIEALCDLEELMRLWTSLRKRFTAVWLHNDDCDVQTPESFRNCIRDHPHQPHGH